MESGRVARAAVTSVEKLAHVLNLVEETGTWPIPLKCGLISLIQKG